MAGSPMQRLSGTGGHGTSVASGIEEKAQDSPGPQESSVAERRQRRMKRLRAEKEELQCALRQSRLRVQQLEAAQVLFTAPSAQVEPSDLFLSAASSPSDSGGEQIPCPSLAEVPPQAQTLLQWRKLRQVLKSHQETLEHEKFMWQAVLRQQEDDEKHIQERVAEAEDMHEKMEVRVQDLMDLMVALLSPGYAPEGQEELINAKYLATIEDLDLHQGLVVEKVESLRAALEAERGENCSRALQLCDQQRRTTRLHDDLCQLQSDLFRTRQDSVKKATEPCRAEHQAEGRKPNGFHLPEQLARELRKEEGPFDPSMGSSHIVPCATPTPTPATVTPATESLTGPVDSEAAKSQQSTGNFQEGDIPEQEVRTPDRLSPEPLSPAAPAVTPSRPEEHGPLPERARIEAAMRDVLEEVSFDHLVVRCNGFYEFGKLARACLRLHGDTLTASVDGLIYEPFKEFIRKLQAPELTGPVASREDVARAPPVQAEPRKPPPSPGSSAGSERGSGRPDSSANGVSSARGASPSQGRRPKMDRRGGTTAPPKTLPLSGHAPSSSSRPSQATGAVKPQQPRPKNGTPRAGWKENGHKPMTSPCRGGEVTCPKVDNRGESPAAQARWKEGARPRTVGSEDVTPSVAGSDQLSRNASSAAGSCVVASSGLATATCLSPATEPHTDVRSPAGCPSPRIRVAGCISPPRVAYRLEAPPRSARAATPQQAPASVSACTPRAATPRSYIPSPALTPGTRQTPLVPAPVPPGACSSVGSSYVMPVSGIRQEGLQTFPAPQATGPCSRIVVTPRRGREAPATASFTRPEPVAQPQSWRAPRLFTPRSPAAPDPLLMRPLQVPQTPVPVSYISPPVPLGRAASVSPPRLATRTMTPVLGTRS